MIKRVSALALALTLAASLTVPALAAESDAKVPVELQRSQLMMTLPADWLSTPTAWPLTRMVT